MRRETPLLVVLLLIAATVAAQDKPDFSGRWVLESPQDSASDVARSLTVRQSIVRTTALGTPMEPFFRDLTVERQFANAVHADSYQIGIIGGVVGGAGPDGKSPQTRYSVRWDGNRLVIETGSYSGPITGSGPYTEHTEVWRLDAESKLVMTVTDRGSGVESATRTLRYRRP